VEGLSVQEAAKLLGIHEKTVRHRIRTGELVAVKVPRPQGFEWQVYLEGSPPAQVEPSSPQVSDQIDSPSVQLNGPPRQGDNAELVRLVEKLHDENRQLAGQVGFLQAKLQDAQERINLLEAPKDEPASPAELGTKPRPWWRRIFNR
jgi:excisionase family DNA binding protein